MAISQERIYAEDGEFWDVVVFVAQLLIRDIGLPLERREPVLDECPSKARIKGKGRMTPQYRLSCFLTAGYLPLQRILGFFADSPKCFVPLQGYVCNLTGSPPVAYDQRMLLAQLYYLLEPCGPDYAIYAAALCRYVDPFFKTADDQLWTKSEVDQFKKEKLPVRELRIAMPRLFQLWLHYIQRHYDRRLWGVDEEGKIRALERCLDGLRNTKERAACPPISTLFSCLKLVDDTLYISASGTSYSLSKEWLDHLLKSYSFPPETTAAVVNLLRMYQHSISSMRKHEQKLIRAPEENRIHKITYNYGDLYYDTPYNKSEKRYVCSIHSSLPKDQWKTPVQLDRNVRLPQKAPQQLLYCLTGGEWDGVRTFAKAAALCCSSKKAPPTAILLSKTVDFTALHLLEWIMGTKLEPYSLSELSEKNAGDTLITEKVNRHPAILAYDDQKKLSSARWKRLKKLISGATVVYEDPVLKRKKHKNEAQWIILGDDRTDQLLSQNRIPHLYLKCHAIPQNFKDIKVSQWLKTYLPLWGLMQLTKRSAKPSEDPAPQTVEQFWRACCRVDSSADFLPAREVYDAYLSYCAQHEYQSTLLFKDFNRAIEERWGQKRCRKHTSTSNLTGYRGLQLIKATPVDTGKETAQEQAFFRRIESIQKEVLSCFPDFPFHGCV